MHTRSEPISRGQTWSIWCCSASCAQAEADAGKGSEDEGEEDLLFVEDRLGQADDEDQQAGSSDDEAQDEAGPGPGSMALQQQEQQQQRGAQLQMTCKEVDNLITLQLHLHCVQRALTCLLTDHNCP